MAQTNVSLEKVIKALECCTQHGSMCGSDCNGHYEYSEPDHKHIVLVGNYRELCPYGKCETGCVKTLARDALAMLKTQEPVSPVKVNRYMDIDENGTWYVPETYDCGNCGVELHGKANYCHLCGRVVKWNG